jgi:hypothetical protein
MFRVVSTYPGKVKGRRLEDDHLASVQHSPDLHAPRLGLTARLNTQDEQLRRNQVVEAGVGEARWWMAYAPAAAPPLG